ncbi:MAG: O-antigen translocase [Bacteroidales bacterium]|nr:O-antigen translocase [Bacteroidales bacterium]
MAPLIRHIRSLASRFARVDLVKVFSITSLSTLVRMCTGLISVKVVAAIIGPAGVAMLGQFGNFVSIILSIASGGINWGITKYVSEYRHDRDTVAAYISTALRITMICTLLSAIIMIVLHRRLAALVMLSADYGYVFLIFGFTLLLYSVNNLLLSIINGYKEFRKFVAVNIANSIVGLLFTVLLVFTWQLRGALIATVTYQSVVLFVTVGMLRKTPWFRPGMFSQRLSRAIASKYFRYTLMTATTALTLPVTQMLLRGYVIAEISPVEAGWWEGMTRISSMYLLVITSSLGVYFLPRLSEIHDRLELRAELIRAYKIILPVLLVGCVAIYLLRHVVIWLLFTDAFAPMQGLFGWQLAGDFFKISSWILAYQMIAKAMTRTFIITEIASSASFLVLGYLFVRLDGITGLCQAYLINYIIYTVTMLVIFRKTLRR